MKIIKLIGFCFYSFIILFSCHSQDNRDINKVIKKQIDSLRIKFNIPAIAYGVIRSDSIIVQNVIGFRNIETKEKTEINDLFHIGSNTKSFTAFIAAKLVELGIVSWDTKFFDIFPEMIAESNQAYHNITLQHLLSHRARLIPFKGESDKPIIEYEKNIKENLSLPEKRYLFVKQVLKYDPIPIYDNQDDRYSNAGYIASAILLEKCSNKKWEELIAEISNDLSLEIHIGWPDSYNNNQPQGHINPKEWIIDMDEKLIPIPLVLRKFHYYNQSIILCTPAGHISIPISGFLEFLRLHIEGLNGKDNYLKSESYKHIFTSYPDYSLGWATRLYDRTCFHHRGSAGTFNSIALIIPDKNIGIVVMTNTHSRVGIDEIVQLLINKFAT